MIRLLLVLPVLVLGLAGLGPGIAGACACGAVVTDQRLEDVQETALVDLAGGRESVTLNIGGRTEADDVAFIMPVPARAAFELADSAVFAELDRLSAPRIEYRDVVVDGAGDGVGGAAPGAPDVTVTDHVAVGPFEVAQLTGADSGAVSDWLARNDFTLPDALAAALTPYLADGWLVVAVRLTPEGADTFADGLPSMRFTFDAETPVYPMRLSATAEYAQPLRLYVLADHRMDVSNPTPGFAEPELTYADWVSPADLADHPTLAGMVDGRRFLTRYDTRPRPDTITSDITFARAPTDDAYRAVVVVKRYVEGTSPALVSGLVVAGALALLATGLGVRRVWSRRTRGTGTA